MNPRIRESIRRLFNQLRRRESQPSGEDQLRAVEAAKLKIMERPLDPVGHQRLGKAYALLGDRVRAIAEYRTSHSLGGRDSELLPALAESYADVGQVELAVAVIRQIETAGCVQNRALLDRISHRVGTAARVPLTSLDHNRYYRLKTLGDHLLKMGPADSLSVLDVGGGDGMLAMFLPDVKYVLAEPMTNGLEAAAFPPRHFDVVVASHVLEHIPLENRSSFLKELCTRSQRGVLVLNPFSQSHGYTQERLQLIIRVTNAEWAKEHVRCTLPQIEEVENFAKSHGYAIRVWPNGCLSTSLAFVFLSHFAEKLGATVDLAAINEFYNRSLFHHLVDADLPTALLVELTPQSITCVGQH